MKNRKNFITLMYVAAIMALTILIFISNLIVSNVFGIIIGILAIVLLCFGLGYMFSKFESERESQGDNLITVDANDKDETDDDEIEVVVGKNETALKEL